MEPKKPIKTVETEIRTYCPVQTLLLVDVIRDRDSRATLLWTVSTLLLGSLAYQWLEGWSYLDALYFSVISPATIGHGDLTPTTPEAKVFTRLSKEIGMQPICSVGKKPDFDLALRTLQSGTGSDTVFLRGCEALVQVPRLYLCRPQDKEAQQCLSDLAVGVC